jgi:hypothetical protein
MRLGSNTARTSRGWLAVVCRRDIPASPVLPRAAAVGRLAPRGGQRALVALVRAARSAGDLECEFYAGKSLCTIVGRV